MTITSRTTNTIRCDVTRCYTQVSWTNEPDTPGLPNEWGSKLGIGDVCPFHNRDEPVCGARLGASPGWMNSDQYDAVACRCDSPPNHDGDCTCSHTREDS